MWPKFPDICVTVEEQFRKKSNTGPLLKKQRRYMWPKFPDICVTVEEQSRKKSQPGNWPDGDRTRARCLRGNDITPRPQRWFDRTLLTYISYEMMQTQSEEYIGIKYDETNCRAAPCLILCALWLRNKSSRILLMNILLSFYTLL